MASRFECYNNRIENSVTWDEFLQCDDEVMITQNLKILFEQALKKFKKKNLYLFETNVNERTLCGALMLELYDRTKWTIFRNRYFVDVEYNRNAGEIKCIINDNYELMHINCDLILHSRGTVPHKDNLIAIEMKKAYQNDNEKDKDRKRLMALTMGADGNVWSADGSTNPQYVCGYYLGAYIEILESNDIYIEYYSKGSLKSKKTI